MSAFLALTIAYAVFYEVFNLLLKTLTTLLKNKVDN